MKQLFFLFLTVISVTGFSQPPLYDDLLIYFADGNYEKLVDKAEKYMENSKTKNDPLPYVYSAKANFEMSKDQEYDEDFPKAFKDAISNAGKALKKDKEGVIFEEHKEFYTTLKESVVEEIVNLVEAGDYSRMRGKIMGLQRMDPDDVGSYFLLTAAFYQLKDKSSAKAKLKEAQAKLDEIESVEDWRDIDKKMLRIGIIEYASYLVQMRQTDSAVEVMNKVKQWFEDDDIFMAKYDEWAN